MALPALAGGGIIDRDVEAENGACSFQPADAGIISVEQFGVNRQILPVVGGYLAAWRNFLEHLGTIMISIQVYLTCISYGKFCHKRAHASVCRAEKRLPEIYGC